MRHIIRELVEAGLLALFVFFFIQLSVQNFRVEGFSMRPNLDDNEYLMVNKLTYAKIDLARLARLVPFWDVEETNEKYLPFAHTPERGDVIVFDAPTRPQDFVKRVVGLPGEKVTIVSGVVHINGKVLDEPYLSTSKSQISMTCTPHTQTFGCVLQENEYFVLGDNRASSHDSRDWGPVPLENIVGKVWFVYWPFPDLPFLGKFLPE